MENKKEEKFVIGDLLVDKIGEKNGKIFICILEKPIEPDEEFASIVYNDIQTDWKIENLRLATENEIKTYKLKNLFKNKNAVSGQIK